MKTTSLVCSLLILQTTLCQESMEMCNRTLQATSTTRKNENRLTVNQFALDQFSTNLCAIMYFKVDDIQNFLYICHGEATQTSLSENGAITFADTVPPPPVWIGFSNHHLQLGEGRTVGSSPVYTSSRLSSKDEIILTKIQVLSNIGDWFTLQYPCPVPGSIFQTFYKMNDQHWK
ncbi:hypothetical protein CAPTEDRAFT_210852 [Capitella teleta]|uniref:Uncharacterized protein n=1 Tax=Capitella teleta TaxID=283909 RepID=R7U9T0_CAPTE|nr:hypothetical protein CAPTEDRAFT_210852 [Capitella teleta]|eukprot:ELT99865.1 hypothetical protein CAPTEDRAFT_210852 [Capitella teleta]